MKLSAEQFRKMSEKRLTLLGMSGVGKTHLSKLLCEDKCWFHYSGDYRIGAEYLNDAILENITKRARKDPWLEKLLKDKSISISNHITYDNLTSVSAFLGKIGNPVLGGLPFEEFVYRQELHKKAEIKAMLDVPRFISKAKKSGANNFINDAGGSLCEIEDENVFRVLAENTIIVYIKASKSNEETLTKRAMSAPKPLYYQSQFLQKQLKRYIDEYGLTYIAQIVPDDFVRWIFPRLLEHRKPKYSEIANKYGYTIDSEALYKCQNSEQVFDLLYRSLE
jgi:hypothetical protein